MGTGLIAFIQIYRGLIMRSAYSEIRQRYAGSVFGLAWIAITPLFFLAIYTVVYLAVFKMRPPGMDSFTYIIHMLSGLLPFLAFSETLQLGTTCLSSNREIFKNTVFPAEGLVVRSVLVGHSNLVFGLLVLCILSVIKNGFNWALLFVPIALVLQVAFLTGVSWFLSLIHILFRDLQNIIGFAVMVLMLASPIAFTSRMIPPGLKALVFLNPAAYFMMCFQAIFAEGAMPSTPVTLVTVIMSICSLCFGYLFFQRMKYVIANYT